MVGKLDDLEPKKCTEEAAATVFWEVLGHKSGYARGLREMVILESTRLHDREWEKECLVVVEKYKKDDDYYKSSNSNSNDVFLQCTALNTINFREENERLNIWVAYINLENEYGNPPQEAVMKVFQRALQYNDPERVYLALLGMYERTEQHKLADELLDKMIKKFKHSFQVWLRRVQRILKQKQDEVQPVVSRALLSLPREKHIDFISQTAILEFKCGVPDRGRSMFERILRESPKRTDLWSVYLDQEIRLGDVDVIRPLFERAISLDLKDGNMKSGGDEERIEYVERQAMEYIRQRQSVSAWMI
ncbi:hypothetical protein F2P56_018980 [Juglans regia]|uniref:Suppressor of forked domain-containing protein n=1 Tax=Juglans regia TaxID=51240 RepID=A0A833WS55_JUGRE|nr:hypothetical protein F2P56_018980 [Juglans regia]